MKIAICQLRTELNPEDTLVKAEHMVSQAADTGSDFVVFPEMFHCPYAGEYFRSIAAQGHKAVHDAMSRWARTNRVYLVGGSVPELAGDSLYNTSFVFDRDGCQIARHRKIHLYDVDFPGMRFKESATFSPGEEITVFDTEFGKMGLAICFDIRFPELFRAMAKRGAKLIFLPAQFNMTTGAAHWEMLLRCRAVDNQVFFAAASAARYEGFRYQCWGHSMVVDPFGTVMASCEEQEQILYADLDLSKIDQVRQQLPTFLHLRSDLYSVAE